MVVVGPHGKEDSPNSLDYPSSGGACWSKWPKLCQDKTKAQLLCLQAFHELVYVWELDPAHVDAAMGKIIEYNEATFQKAGFRFTVLANISGF